MIYAKILYELILQKKFTESIIIFNILYMLHPNKDVAIQNSKHDTPLVQHLSGMAIFNRLEGQLTLGVSKRKWLNQATHAWEKLALFLNE